MTNSRSIFVVTVYVDEPKIGKYIDGYLIFQTFESASAFVAENPPSIHPMFEDDTGGNAFGPPPGIISYENITSHEAPAEFLAEFDKLLKENNINMAFVKTLLPSSTQEGSND